VHSKEKEKLMIMFELYSKKLLTAAIVCGFLVSLATGLVSRNIMSIPENKYYGFPLVWRVTSLFEPTKYVISNFAIDAVFWVTISLLTFIILARIFKKTTSTSDVSSAAAATAAAAATS